MSDNPKTFTLSMTEAAYALAGLRIIYETADLNERDHIIITGLMDKLAAPMNLSDATLTRLNQPRRKS